MSFRRGSMLEVTVETPHPLIPPNEARAIGWDTREHRQVLLDRLAASAVLLLVLVTITMSVLYVAHELPRWRGGQLGGFEITSVPMNSDSVASAVPDSTAHPPAPNRVPLVLISMLIEMVIFVGLGLFLRREMDRLP